MGDLQLEVLGANVYSTTKNAIIKGVRPVFPRVSPVNDLLQAKSLEGGNRTLNENANAIIDGHKNLKAALLGMSSRSYSGRMELTVRFDQLQSAVRFFGELLPRLSLGEDICLLPTELVARFYIAHLDICATGCLSNLKFLEAQVGPQQVNVNEQELARHCLAAIYFLQVLRGYLFTGSTLGQVQNLVFDRPSANCLTMDGRYMVARHNFLPYTIFSNRNDPAGRVDFESCTLVVPHPDDELQFLNMHCLKALLSCFPRAEAFLRRQQAIFLKHSIAINTSMRNGRDLAVVARHIASAYVETIKTEFGGDREDFALSLNFLQRVYGGHFRRHVREVEQETFLDLVTARFNKNLITTPGWAQMGYVKLLALYFGIGNESFMAVRAQPSVAYYELLMAALRELGVEALHDEFGENIFWVQSDHFVQIPPAEPVGPVPWDSMHVGPAENAAVARDDRALRAAGEWTNADRAHLAFAYFGGECSDSTRIKLASPLFAGRRTCSQLVAQAKNYRRAAERLARGRRRRVDPFSSYGLYRQIQEVIAELRPRGFFDLPTDLGRHYSVQDVREFITQSLALPEEEAKARMPANPILEELRAEAQEAGGNNAVRVEYQPWLDRCNHWARDRLDEFLEGRPAPSLLMQNVRGAFQPFVDGLAGLFTVEQMRFWLDHHDLDEDEWRPTYSEFLAEQVRAAPAHFIRGAVGIPAGWTVRQLLAAVFFARRTTPSLINDLSLTHL